MAWTIKEILKHAVIGVPLVVFTGVMLNRAQLNRAHIGRIRSLVGHIRGTLTGGGAIALDQSVGHLLRLQ